MSLREELERRRAALAANGNTTNKPNGTAAAFATATSEISESAKPSPLPVSPSPPLFLRLVKLNRQCWLLPWACFHGVSYEPSSMSADATDKCERLHFVFMRHEVTVSGHNLAGVVDAIEETNLRELCEVAEKYQPLSDTNASLVIVGIEVNAR